MSLVKKIRNFGIGSAIAVSSLLPMKSLGQETAEPNYGNQNNIENIEDNWNFSLTLLSLHPHDSDLKDIFGSYLAIQPEIQRKIAKNVYLSVNGTLGWAKESEDDWKIYAYPKELAAIFEYRFGEGERSQFSIGGGPKISGLTLKLKEGKDDISEDYSGFGYTIRMHYKYRINDKLAILVLGGYSGVKDEEADLNIGNTIIAVGLEF